MTNGKCSESKLCVELDPALIELRYCRVIVDRQKDFVEIILRPWSKIGLSI